MSRLAYAYSLSTDLSSRLFPRLGVVSRVGLPLLPVPEQSSSLRLLLIFDFAHRAFLSPSATYSNSFLLPSIMPRLRPNLRKTYSPASHLGSLPSRRSPVAAVYLGNGYS